MLAPNLLVVYCPLSSNYLKTKDYVTFEMDVTGSVRCAFYGAAGGGREGCLWMGMYTVAAFMRGCSTLPLACLSRLDSGC